LGDADGRSSSASRTIWSFPTTTFSRRARSGKRQRLDPETPVESRVVLGLRSEELAVARRGLLRAYRQYLDRRHGRLELDHGLLGRASLPYEYHWRRPAWIQRSSRRSVPGVVGAVRSTGRDLLEMRVHARPDLSRENRRAARSSLSADARRARRRSSRVKTTNALRWACLPSRHRSRPGAPKAPSSSNPGSG